MAAAGVSRAPASGRRSGRPHPHTPPRHAPPQAATRVAPKRIDSAPRRAARASPISPPCGGGEPSSPARAASAASFPRVPPEAAGTARSGTCRRAWRPCCMPARELAREGNRAIAYACLRGRAAGRGNQTARERIDREPPRPERCTSQAACRSTTPGTSKQSHPCSYIYIAAAILQAAAQNWPVLGRIRFQIHECNRGETCTALNTRASCCFRRGPGPVDCRPFQIQSRPRV